MMKMKPIIKLDDKNKNVINDDTLSLYILKAMHFRTVAHLMHFKTSSYAQHIALNEFYDSFLNNIDRLAEKFIGQYGRLSFSVNENYLDYKNYTDVEKYLEDVEKWLNELYDSFFNNSWIVSILDDIKESVVTLSYKLTLS